MARYKDAIRWLIEYDDNDWLDGEEGTADGQPTVSASLVADLFGKEDSQVRCDLISERERHRARVTRSVAQVLRGNGYK